MNALNTQSGTAVITTGQAEKHLEYHMDNGDTCILFGAPGVGKTEMVKQVAAKLGHDVLIMHPQIADPTDFKGMPGFTTDANGERVAEFLPFGDLRQMINAEHPLTAFIDDFGSAARMVQAAIQQLILERRVDGHKISDHVRFVLCANRAEDKAGTDQGFLTTIKGRATLYTVEPTVEDWCKWANKQGYPAECIGFIRWQGLEGLWSRANPNFKCSYGTDNERQPRTVTKSFDQYWRGIPAGMELPMYQGNTDAGWAVAWVAFAETFHALPDLDAIYKNPKSFNPPSAEHPDVQFAVTAAIAGHATERNASKFFKLVKKLPADFRTYAVKDAYTRTPGIANSPGFVDWITENPDVIDG